MILCIMQACYNVDHRILPSQLRSALDVGPLPDASITPPKQLGVGEKDQMEKQPNWVPGNNWWKAPRSQVQ